MRLAIIFLAFSIWMTPVLAAAQERAGDPAPDGVPTSYVRKSEIDNIKKIIGEKTPEFISKPIIAATQAIEKFRKDQADKSEDKVYHFVFANPYVFYVIFSFLVLVILRTLWRMIF